LHIGENQDFGSSISTTPIAADEHFLLRHAGTFALGSPTVPLSRGSRGMNSSRADGESTHARVDTFDGPAV
jgi:hypothetical protein